VEQILHTTAAAQLLDALEDILLLVRLCAHTICGMLGARSGLKLWHLWGVRG